MDPVGFVCVDCGEDFTVCLFECRPPDEPDERQTEATGCEAACA